MSKQHNIRWRRSDYSKLSHTIRKFNKKAFENQVKRPDIAEYQPELIDYQEVKKSIKTRQDLKNFIKKHERYLRDGAEEVLTSDRGAKATKWAVNEFEIAQRAENTRRRHRAKQLGEKDVTIGGKSTGNKRSQMGDVKENEVKESKKKFKNQSQREWELASRLFDKKMHSTYNDEKQQQMIENYVKGLISEGYSNELIKIMNRIPIERFMEIIDTDELATFDFIYDPLLLSARQDYLIELWQQYVDEEVDNHINFDDIRSTVASEYQMGLRVLGQGRIRKPKRRRR